MASIPAPSALDGSKASAERTKQAEDEEDDSSLSVTLQSRHLDWSLKQSRILTADGKAVEYYRGVPFEQEELPHYHLQSKKTHAVFSKWSEGAPKNHLVCGAWTRTLFYGGWEHSTSQDELTYNLQTPTLFIDLRIPTTRRQVLPPSARSLKDYDDSSLRLYARQHVFAGYTQIQMEEGKLLPVCTRFHCIDWNYVGAPRPIPNKWWVQMAPDEKKWKEWAYAIDENGQYYYCEHWERLDGGDSNGVTLALRKASTSEGPDGVLVVVGDHFSYIFGRRMTGAEKEYPDAKSLVDLIDTALAAGDRVTAESYLSIDAGHGNISKGWLIDCAIQPWKEGERLSGMAVVGADKLEDCRVTWMGHEWEIYSCSMSNVSELNELFSPKKKRLHSN